MAVIVTYTNEYGDSIEFSKNSDIRITGIDGLSANSIELSEATVTNQVGSSITGASIQSRMMTIEGRYFYTPATRKRLLAVILPGINARLRYQNTVENVDVYWEGQPTKTPDISTNPVWQNFQFTMKMPYPYPRFSAEEQRSFFSFRSSFRFPQAYSSKKKWRISTKMIFQSLSVRNKGDLDAGFTVEFLAKADGIESPKLINEQTGEFIGFTGLILQNGDILRICTVPNQKQTLILRKGTTINAFEYCDYESSFFLLKKGDNPIRYEASRGAENLETTLTFEEVLAGV